MSMIEPGRCSPLECNNDTYSFITCTGDGPLDRCTIGSCTDAVSVPASVPIKQLLKGSMASPWVRLRFVGSVTDSSEWDYTEITTGNISQPGGSNRPDDPDGPGSYCRAVIKSFQYGWGTINSGNKCKITIVDEEGSSFRRWWERLDKNPENMSRNDGQGSYKMKITFGWLVVGGDEDGGCPAQIAQDSSGTCTDSSPYSSVPEQLICSPALWFLPDSITVNLSNGKFIYEIEGIDTMFRVAEQTNSETFGSETTADDASSGPTHFKDAVEALASRSLPPFRVEFKQLNEDTGDLEDLQFFVPPDVANVRHVHYSPSPTCTYDSPCIETTLTPTDLEARGPLGVWKCQAMNPIAAIHQWIGDNVAAKSTRIPGGRKGITLNYDSTYNDESAGTDDRSVIRGRLLIWGSAHPDCFSRDEDYDPRLVAAYVVNGGKCSPVYSFTPNIRWNFQAAMRAGGTTGPQSGQMLPSSDNSTDGRCQVPGVGVRNEVVTSNNARNAGGNANRNAVGNLAANRRANFLTNSIEAELRVQGDPSSFLCSPIEGTGKTIALVVINPFYIDDNGSDNCMDWEWSTLTNSACNDILTNRGWFIRGVEHQIKEGSYVTTYKLALYVPRSETGGRNQAVDPDIASGPPTQIGLDSTRNQDSLCPLATVTCDDRIVVSDPDFASPGMNEFCDQSCSTNTVIQ